MVLWQKCSSSTRFRCDNLIFSRSTIFDRTSTISKVYFECFCQENDHKGAIQNSSLDGSFQSRDSLFALLVECLWNVVYAIRDENRQLGDADQTCDSYLDQCRYLESKEYHVDGHVVSFGVYLPATSHLSHGRVLYLGYSIRFKNTQTIYDSFDCRHWNALSTTSYATRSKRRCWHGTWTQTNDRPISTGTNHLP